jgi:SAM-dependent methyltransferase
MGIREKLEGISKAMRRKMIPTLKHAQTLYKETLEAQVNSMVRWLDVGCGEGLLSKWYNQRIEIEQQLVRSSQMIIGVEPDWEPLKANKTIPDAHKVQGQVPDLPFKNDLFDLVTANMAVEHFVDAKGSFQEIFRILKPGGLFIFHTPNVYGYDTMLGRLIPDRSKDKKPSLKEKLAGTLFGKSKHGMYPTLYQANSASRIKELAQSTGFTVCKIRMVVSNEQLSAIPPLAFFELLLIRLLMIKPLKNLRHNIIAILQKR